MAPQLCRFVLPGKLSFSSLVFVLIFSAFLMSGKHLPEERKTPIGPIHIVFLLGPTQTSFSFPPAGTPEATSWEQEQMARPHLQVVTGRKLPRGVFEENFAGGGDAEVVCRRPLQQVIISF